MQRVIKSPARREGEQEEECFPVLFVVLQDAFAEVGIVNSVHQVEQIRGLSQATFVDIYGDSKKTEVWQVWQSLHGWSLEKPSAVNHS